MKKDTNNSKGVHESSGLDWSEGVNKSSGVRSSKGVSHSNGVNESYGVSWSDGVNRSDGVSWSDGVNRSDGVTGSNGVNRSDGVTGSNGVNRSDGVSWSYGVLNSFGVDKALFLADKKRTFSIFGVEVSEERFYEVIDELYTRLAGWYPKFNTAEISAKLPKWDEPYEAWKDMPIQAIEYVKSLPEFDAALFKRITGIDVTVNKLDLPGKTAKVEIDGVSYEADAVRLKMVTGIDISASNPDLKGKVVKIEIV